MIDPDTLETFVKEQCTEKEQEAIQLVWIEGKGIRKTAELLHVDTRTIRDRLDRVRVRAAKHGLQP